MGSTNIRSNYFSDGKSAIDYVIVVSTNIKNRPVYMSYVARYFSNLQELGVKMEIDKSADNHYNFIKIHLPSRVLKHFATVYNVDIKNAGHKYIKTPELKCGIFQTPLTEENRDIFKRRRTATSVERILITHELLNDVKFGKDEDLKGLRKLLSMKVIRAAYPLHDGDYRFANLADSELNDRQLLLKYWANFGLWYKKQPLNLIEKYYGSEIAFYFAWLGFYNLMLIPASVFGIICFLISVIDVHTNQAEKDALNEVCKSDLLMCHLCYNIQSCTFSHLKSSCLAYKLATIFEHGATIAFAIFMSFWASLFLSLWKEVENILKLRWNVQHVETDTKIRYEYKIKATSTKVSTMTGNVEPCIPTRKRILYITITYGVCLALLSLVFLVVIVLIVYRLWIASYLTKTSAIMYDYVMIMVMISGSILQVIFIKIFGLFYAPLSVWLTNIENPRTQYEFDKSVIHKRYFLGFANNYVPLFYIAFIKGRLYNPQDDIPSNYFSLKDDICSIPGCLVSLCIQLSFYMFFKSMMGNIVTLIKPKILRLFKKKKTVSVELPQVEVEYNLDPSDDYLLTTEFMEMIIQYGFVTFFVTAFPLAPLCALINNMMELRLDAYKFVTRHRRPVPKKYNGIGTWNSILKSITYLSTVTNAFVLAFTTDFVAKEVYKYQHGNLTGYIYSTLSTIDLQQYRDDQLKHGDTELKNDFAEDVFRGKEKECFYQGMRESSSSPHPYEYTINHFYILGIKLLCVIVFEHVIMVLRGIILYLVPDMPRQVTEAIHAELNAERELKIKLLAENFNRSLDKRPRSSVMIQKRTTVSY